MPILRGSSQTQEFYMPFEAKNVERIEIIFHQGDIDVMKETADCEIKDYLIVTKLSQKDTLRFFNGVRSVKIQLRVKPFGNDPVYSEEVVDRVLPSLFNEEM